MSEREESSVDEEPSRSERSRTQREALIGKSIAGRYVLRAVVGHGGMGAVYEAEHLGLGKKVAIKFIDQEFATDERVVARFAREARAMSAIESAHIVTVFDAGTEEGRPYLVMELLRGEDLGQRLRRLRRCSVPEALHIVAQVLKGLAKAHAAGIVHRDLKPDNVFLVKTDVDPVFAKIVDFGVSKIERPRDKTSPLALTGRGTVLGTPFYMSPEQAQAMPDVDARADIYSVGAILFECLAGRPPHTGETYEQIILSICMRDAPDLRAIDPKVPKEVAGFVARALSRDRTHRFGSAERMLAALHELAPEEKARVPLDAGAPDTLMSPGVLFPTPRRGEPAPVREPIGMATRIAGSGDIDPAKPTGIAPTTVVSPSPAAGEQRPAAPEEIAPISVGALSARLRAKSRATLAVTAIVALLTGVGVMLGVVRLFGKSPPSSGAPPTITSGVTTTAVRPPTSAGAASSTLGLPSASGAASSTLGLPSTSGVEAAPTPTGASAAGTDDATPSSAPGPSAKPAPPAAQGKKPVPKASGGKPLDISRDLP